MNTASQSTTSSLGAPRPVRRHPAPIRNFARWAAPRLAILALLAFASPRPLAAQSAAVPPPGSSFAQAWHGAPEGFIPPPLHPAGVQLTTRQLAPGVYALLSGTPAVDNSGFIVGDRGVLVIDSHINGAMADQIIRAVRQVTAKPILYLVNTNYHGDHTFGNSRFPAETTIVAHVATAERMRDFEAEKNLILTTVQGDRDVLKDVRLRLPDVVFERTMRIDLGGRAVELHHFGAGNTPGDVVVFEPESRTAWTGNFVLGAGMIPPLFEFGAATYADSIGAMQRALDVAVIIPGHGAPNDASVFAYYQRYLGEILGAAREAIDRGQSLDRLLADRPLPAAYLPPDGAVPPEVTAFLKGLHRMNLAQTYREQAAGR